MTKKSKALPMALPKTIRIFVNDFTRNSDAFLQVQESAEDAFVASEGQDVVVGIYELKQRVRLVFKAEEVPA